MAEGMCSPHIFDTFPYQKLIYESVTETLHEYKEENAGLTRPRHTDINYCHKIKCIFVFHCCPSQPFWLVEIKVENSVLTWIKKLQEQSTKGPKSVLICFCTKFNISLSTSSCFHLREIAQVTKM